MRAAIASLALAATALSAAPARADDFFDDRAGIALELPVVDLPFNVRKGLTGPSMAQSLALTTDVYMLLHYGMGQLIDPYDQVWWRKLLGRTAIVGLDLLVTNLPLAVSWQHEEGHRAVLSNEKISSFNGTYSFHPFSSVTAVSKVSDDDLRAFKARDPQGFVRMSTAGLEMNLELATRLEKTQLFYRTRTWQAGLLAEIYAINSIYQLSCASSDADKTIADEEKREGADISKRDFTGLDCTAAVYDMFRPNEAYDARGVHPSGVGVRRYRRQSDLTSAERSYLKNQAYLSLLNVIDPAVFGFESFEIGAGPRGKKFRFNAHIRHTPAPFGQSIALETYGQYGDFNGLVALQGGLSHDRFYPGLNAELHRFPMDLVIGLPLSVSLRTALWLQPKDLAFEKGSYAPGALGALRVGYALAREFEPYVEVEGKAAGWVPGNVWLGPNASVRVGFFSMLFQ